MFTYTTVRSYHVLILLTACMPVLFPLQAQAAAPLKVQPNILLLLSEDQGLQLGCYGDKIARTPNLDQLAQEGVRFTNAYVVQAGCSPSRAALLTGLYPHQNGQIGLATHAMRMYSGLIPTLPRLLKEGSYHTALIGKLHVKPETAFPFDTRVSVETFNKRDVKTVAKEAAAVFTVSDKPFFLQISYADTHSPFVPKNDGGLPVDRQNPDVIDSIPMLGHSTPTIRETLAHYYDCIARLDIGIGLVLDALEASGKADNTLVIFMSDHGPQMVRGKMSCYEGGLRIPMIIRFPGQAAPGTIRDELVNELDLAPTFLAVAGIEAPDFWPGLSMLPLLNGPARDWRQRLYSEFTLHWPVTYFPQRSVRDSRYKLIHNLLTDRANPVCTYNLNEKTIPTITVDDIPQLPVNVRQSMERFANPPEYELYDLQADPWELHNLADSPEYQTILVRLQQDLQRWQVESDDPLRHDDVLQRFTAEVATTFTGPNGTYDHVGRKASFKWSYPEYFAASMREETRRMLGLSR